MILNGGPFQGRRDGRIVEVGPRMSFLLHHLPDVVATFVGIAIQWAAALWIIRTASPARRDFVRRIVTALAVGLSALFLASLGVSLCQDRQTLPCLADEMGGFD